MVFEIGIPSYGKIVICQDNTSTIRLTANEGNFLKNRHVKIRSNFCERKVDVRYQPTTDMVADIGTKPVASNVMNRLVEALNMFELKPSTG